MERRYRLERQDGSAVGHLTYEDLVREHDAGRVDGSAVAVNETTGYRWPVSLLLERGAEDAPAVPMEDAPRPMRLAPYTVGKTAAGSLTRAVVRSGSTAGAYSLGIAFAGLLGLYAWPFLFLGLPAIAIGASALINGRGSRRWLSLVGLALGVA